MKVSNAFNSRNELESKDFYDTIIEKYTKESADNSIAWEIPKFSKKQIDRAGKMVASKFTNQDDCIQNDKYTQAIEILNNWRASHAYPLKIITDNLQKGNPDTLVVQRLKRLDSIIGKIRRFPDMSLYRMQDLGGCRVIVDTIEEVYESVDRFKCSEVSHIFRRENDYIQQPKESGYRSYHAVYQFQDDENEAYNKNILIEIQFRTRLQHVWATAVEMMGTYTKSQLKSSKGDADILRFFVLVSSLFAKREGTPICPNTTNDELELVEEIKEIDKRLHLVDRISAMSVAISKTSVPTDVRIKAYYVLLLNYKERMLRIAGFSAEQIGLATKIYNEIEAKNDKDIDVVLVSAESFTDLQEAYPNYFVDIREFVTVMRDILE